MSTDAKSTNEVRMIAADVVRQQAEVCEVKRENIDDKLVSMAMAAATNTANIAANTASIGQLITSVAVLKGRPALWGAIGAAAGACAPLLLGVLLWWFNK